MRRQATRIPAAARFLAAGALLFAVSRLLGPAPARPVIRVTAEDVSRLRAEALAAGARLPEGVELSRRLEAVVEDEILVREALARGLAESDGAVRRRLAQVLLPEGSEADDLYRDAVALGLERTDPGVRRRLIQRMHAAIAAAACDGRAEAALEPGSAPVSRLSLHHVFFRRHTGRDADASLLLERLRSTGEPSWAHLGDPFPAGNELPASSEADLARWFGSAFAAQVMALPERQWAGPMRSPYGSHLVWVRERHLGTATAAGTPSSAGAAAMGACGDRAVRAALARLLPQYDVVLEAAEVRR